MACTGGAQGPVIASFGNPLLDMLVVTEDTKILDKFNFGLDSQAEIPANQFDPIFQEVAKNYGNVKYKAGGSAQNTCRVLQWIMKDYPKFVVFFGRLGHDERGKELKKIMAQDNTETRYSVTTEFVTGACIGIIVNQYRTLLAHIGAAQHYSIENLTEDPECMTILEKVDIIYIEGYFITQRVPVSKYLMEFANQHSKTFVFNLNAVYLVDEETEDMKYFAYNSDILFGNRREYHAIAEYLDMPCDKSSRNVALHINKLYNVKNIHKYSRYKKIVVVTDGPNSVVCVSGDENLIEVEVPRFGSACNIIKDTTGAGDAFVAGFLAALFLDKPLDVCVKWGCWAAKAIIYQVGVNIPDLSLHNLYQLV